MGPTPPPPESPALWPLGLTQELPLLTEVALCTLSQRTGLPGRRDWYCQGCLGRTLMTSAGPEQGCGLLGGGALVSLQPGFPNQAVLVTQSLSMFPMGFRIEQSCLGFCWEPGFVGVGGK